MTQVGTVDENGDPRLDLRVRGPRGDVIHMSVVADTGFSGAIVLGTALIAELKLELLAQSMFTLADGSDRIVNTYMSEVEWFGRWRRLRVVELEGGPLAGMILFRGRRLTIDAVEGGRVLVESIRTSE